MTNSSRVAFITGASLVNNAGILKVVPLAQTSDEWYAQSFSINTQGVAGASRPT